MPTVLIADDSLSVRKVAERMLTEVGLEVTLAANGEEAMSMASAKQPDLIITDVIMPDKSGFEVCAYIRAQANLANTPVLLVSGFVDDEVTRQAEACKADGVIKKPFQGAMLRERVMELLASRKAPEAPAAAAVPELVLELPVAAPEPATTFQAAPAAPAPAPAAMAAALAAPLAISDMQLAGEVRTLHETIQRLEGRVAEQEKALAELERQLHAFKESTTQAFTQVQSMEARLAELEPSAASAKQLLQALAEFARQTIKP